MSAPINNAPQPASPPTDQPVVPLSRPVEIARNLSIGAALGYGIYWVGRLGCKIGYLSEETRLSLNPVSFVLAGLIRSAIIETATLVYDGAMAILGDRQQYENALSANSTRFDRFRKHSWKIIATVENLVHKVDTVFSSILKIRTAREIRTLEANLKPDELLILRITEIFRRALVETLAETLSSAIPLVLAIISVQALGFPIAGAQYILEMNLQPLWILVGFVGGVILKIGFILQNDEEKIKKAKEAKEAKQTNPQAILANQASSTSQPPKPTVAGNLVPAPV